MIVDAKELISDLRKNLKDEIKDIKLKLAMIRIGDKPSDLSYEKAIIKACNYIGVDYESHIFDDNVDEETILKEIDKLNYNQNIDGILLFRPLKNKFNEYRIKNRINPDKDIDGATSSNLSKLMENREGLRPCTPLACIKFLEYNKIDLKGKNVLIINRSLVFGRPLAMMLIDRDATVTIAHSKTKNIESLIEGNDIVISAIGRAKYFKNIELSKDKIVLDVGVSLDEDSKLSGDFDIEKYKDKLKIITPVKGGIGSITTSLLIDNLLKAKRLKGEYNER